MRLCRYPVVLLACGWACCCTAAMCAQQPDLKTLLQGAAAQAATLATALPSFACQRNGASEVVRAQDGRLKKQVPFTGEVRALRNGHDLDEKITYTSVNGKPSKKQGDAPYDVYESFTRALQYLSAGEQACYAYSLHDPVDGGGTRVDFAAAPPFRPRCENLPGTEGFVLFDPQGQVTHLERTVPEQLAAEADLVPYAAVDLAPVVLDGTTYWLVARLQSERQDGKEIRRVDVRYTDCRLFHADVTLLPDVETVPSDGAKP